MDKQEAKLELVEIRCHRSAFDQPLPEDCRVFAFCEDDDREEMKLLVLSKAA